MRGEEKEREREREEEKSGGAPVLAGCQVLVMSAMQLLDSGELQVGSEGQGSA